MRKAFFSVACVGILIGCGGGSGSSSTSSSSGLGTTNKKIFKLDELKGYKFTFEFVKESPGAHEIEFLCDGGYRLLAMKANGEVWTQAEYHTPVTYFVKDAYGNHLHLKDRREITLFEKDYLEVGYSVYYNGQMYNRNIISASKFSDCSSSDENNNHTGSLPNIYGYDYIQIINNVNAKDSALSQIKNQHLNQPDYINVVVNKNTHCENYQFDSGDMHSSDGNTMQYVTDGSTIEATDYCTEVDYSGTRLSGHDTIVIAYNFHKLK